MVKHLRRVDLGRWVCLLGTNGFAYIVVSQGRKQANTLFESDPTVLFSLFRGLRVFRVEDGMEWHGMAHSQAKWNENEDSVCFVIWAF